MFNRQEYIRNTCRSIVWESRYDEKEQVSQLVSPLMSKIDADNQLHKIIFEIDPTNINAYCTVESRYNPGQYRVLAELAKIARPASKIEKEQYIQKILPEIKWESRYDYKGEVSQLVSSLMTEPEAKTQLEKITKTIDPTNIDSYRTVESRYNPGQYRLLADLETLKPIVKAKAEEKAVIAPELKLFKPISDTAKATVGTETKLSEPAKTTVDTLCKKIEETHLQNLSELSEPRKYRA